MRISNNDVIAFNDALILAIEEPYNEIAEAASEMHVASLQPFKNDKLKEISQSVKQVVKEFLGKNQEADRFTRNFVNQLRVHSYDKTKYKENEVWNEINLVDNAYFSSEKYAETISCLKGSATFILLAEVCLFSLAYCNQTSSSSKLDFSRVNNPVANINHQALYTIALLGLVPLLFSSISYCLRYARQSSSAKQKETCSFYFDNSYHKDVLNALEVSTEFYEEMTDIGLNKPSYQSRSSASASNSRSID